MDTNKRGGNRRGGTPNKFNNSNRENKRGEGREERRTPSFGKGGNRRGGAPSKFKRSDSRDDRQSEDRGGERRRPSFGKDDNRRSGAPSKFRRSDNRDDKQSEDRGGERRRPSFGKDDNRRSGAPNKFRRSDSRDDRQSEDRGGERRRPSFGKDNNRRSGAPSKFRRSNSRDDKQSEDRGGERRRPSFDKKEGFRRPGNKFGNKPFRRRTKNKDISEVTKTDSKIRLNKYIAKSGLCSRREADEYIKNGMVEVNGTMIIEMGYKVDPTDDVRLDGKILTPENKIYILLNKPKGFITTTNDERDRKTVMDLVKTATTSRVFPVGRLDRQTTGVLLFTNDGDLTKKLTHPSHDVRKIYHVILDKPLHGDDMEKVRKGIPMTEGIARVDKVSYIEGKDRNEVGVEIHIGWNRVVRRIFERLGYKIVSLDRVSFAGLTKKNVKRGTWRILDKKEIEFLKMV